MENKSFTVKSVTDDRSPSFGTASDNPLWRIVLLKDDDPPYEHVIFLPHEAFGSRVAEYGLDTEDFEKVLEVVLYEPFMNEVHELDPNFLWNTDQETARLHHLARVSRLKDEYTYNDPGKLFDVIRASYDPYSSHHDAMKEHVKNIRNSLKAAGT